MIQCAEFSGLRAGSRAKNGVLETLSMSMSSRVGREVSLESAWD